MNLHDLSEQVPRLSANQGRAPRTTSTCTHFPIRAAINVGEEKGSWLVMYEVAKTAAVPLHSPDLFSGEINRQVISIGEFGQLLYATTRALPYVKDSEWRDLKRALCDLLFNADVVPKTRPECRSIGKMLRSGG